ncbi:MAG: hypothetical protein EXR11_02480 [Rhodospirillaceae bacterium]|nr:hypothetical protein [Rhodospirillaceae bacterium]
MATLKEAAAAAADENTEPDMRTTHFDFVNKVFKVPKARFYKPENFDEPVFVVDLGDLQGEVRFKHLKRQFQVEYDTHDDKLLETVVKALNYVEDIRPGDQIPNEILDGSASWTVSPKHKLLAKSRLEAQLISWISGKEAQLKSMDEMNAFLADKENRSQLRLAFAKAAEQLGLKADDTTAVLLRLEMLARELCFIEALREAFNVVPGIAVRLKQLAETYAGDMRMMDTLERVKGLLRKGVQEYKDIFVDLDSQTGEIISAMKSLDRQIVFIRERRDRLRYLQMKWTPLVRAWSELVINQGANVQDLLGRTYRFLATRFDTSKSLMKARKEQEEQQRQAQLQREKEEQEKKVRAKKK